MQDRGCGKDVKGDAAEDAFSVSGTQVNNLRTVIRGKDKPPMESYHVIKNKA